MKIDLTIDQINIIMAALQEAPMPHRATDPVIRHIFQQVQEAQAPAAPEAQQPQPSEAS